MVKRNFHEFPLAGMDTPVRTGVGVCRGLYKLAVLAILLRRHGVPETEN